MLNSLLEAYRNSNFNASSLREKEKFIPRIADFAEKFQQSTTIEDILTVHESKHTRRSLFQPRKTLVSSPIFHWRKGDLIDKSTYNTSSSVWAWPKSVS